MPDAIAQFSNAKYFSLETFRKTGVGVRTPVWFAEDPALPSPGGITTFYVYTLPDSGKTKRIRNRAPCAVICAGHGWTRAPASVPATR